MEIRTDTLTREQWLNAAVEVFRPWFDAIGYTLPELVHVSVGFPLGAKGESKYVLAQCFIRAASSTGVNEIFMSPYMDDAPKVLLTLMHELGHASDDCKSGHTGDFEKMMTTFGLIGRMTVPECGPVLAAKLITIAETLGPYPHKTMDAELIDAPRVNRLVPVTSGGPGSTTVPRVGSGPVKQTTRMLKVACQHEDCPCGGYSVRTTAKWLEIGFPFCPMGKQMSEA